MVCVSPLSHVSYCHATAMLQPCYSRAGVLPVVWVSPAALRSPRLASLTRPAHTHARTHACTLARSLARTHAQCASRGTQCASFTRFKEGLLSARSPERDFSHSSYCAMLLSMSVMLQLCTEPCEGFLACKLLPCYSHAPVNVCHATAMHGAL